MNDRVSDAGHEVDVVFVVPTLGLRPEWLRRTLQSVASQGDVTMRIIVVGPSSDMIRSAAEDAGATYLQEPDKKGLSAAINRAAGQFARDSTYVAWLGDDDLLAPDSLRETVAAMNEHPRWAACFGGLRIIDATGCTVCVYRPHRWQLWYSLVGGNFIPQPGSLFRSSAWFNVAGLDESYAHAMDLDLFHRLARVGKVGVVNAEVAAYRRHDSTITATKSGPSENDRIRSSHGRGLKLLRALMPELLRARVEHWANRLTVTTPGPHPAELPDGSPYTG